MEEGEKLLQRDRERVARDFDPYQTESFNIYRTNPRRQEAYNQCAHDVVALMRCVDAEGPAWFWRCNKLHIELQKCYEAHKKPPPNPFEGYIQATHENVQAAWSALQSALDSWRSGSGPGKQ